MKNSVTSDLMKFHEEMLGCLSVDQNLIEITQSPWRPGETGYNGIINPPHLQAACSVELVPDSTMTSSKVALWD